MQYKRNVFTFFFQWSLTSAYIECATGKWYHSRERPESFIEIGLLQRSQLALYERSFEHPASLLKWQNVTPDPLYTHSYVKVAIRLTLEVATLRQIALCMIQYARVVFSENSLCMLELSILAKCCTRSLAKLFMQVLFHFATCFQKLFYMTRWGSFSWSNETVPQVLVLRLLVNIQFITCKL